MYDPFVCRGLDALIYALYSGASFVFAGTPSGITLAPEGGAHQSSVTASLGVDRFGQSGTIADLYREYDLDAGSIVNAALGLVL